MNAIDLITKRNRVARRPNLAPLGAVHSEIDRIFERMFDNFGLPAPWRNELLSWDSAWPAVNVAEDKDEIVVTAELPGVDEKDVSIELEDQYLTLRGQTETEQEKSDRRWARIERCTGCFERVIELPAEVLEEDARASFERGILTIRLRKAEPEASRKRVIPIE